MQVTFLFLSVSLSCIQLVGLLVVLFCFVLRRIKHFRVISQRIKFQTIQFSINTQFSYKLLNVKTAQLNVKITQLNVKTVLFQTIQFSLSTQFSSIKKIIFQIVQFSIGTQFQCWLVGWLFRFYSISTFIGYLMPNPFYSNNQFYFKPFSLAWVHSLIVKNISISNNSVLSNSSYPSNSL